MSRRHHTPPTGVRRTRATGPADRTDPFWGDTADWPTSDVPVVSSGHRTEWTYDDAPAPIADVDRYAELGEPLDDESTDDRWEAAWQPAARPTAGIDPFVLRIGAVVVALTFAVPLFLGFRSDGDATATIRTTAGAVEPASASPAPTSAPEAVTDSAATEPADPETASGDAPESSDSADGADEPVEATPSCGLDYDVAAGDFWIRIADGAGVELSDLLGANDATVDSPLFPGSSICLPAGASIPPPPETPAALTADGSGSNAVSSGATASATAQPVPGPRLPPVTAPPTTAAPTTTAPATTAPPSDVVAIIRSVWPDDLEERAITIAWRESNHRPEVYNGFCCYGLFQIYYDVHRSWLATDLGITSAQQLLDPVLNSRAAYRLYERAGGWGPWSQTNY